MNGLDCLDCRTPAPRREPDRHTTEVSNSQNPVQIVARALEQGLPIAEVRGRSDADSQVSFETLLSDIATRCTNVASDDVDREISSALARTCQLLSIDFAALWQQSIRTNRMTSTHSYPPLEQVGVLESPTEEMYPWVTNQVRNGEMVRCARLADLPDEAAVDAKNAQAVGIKSNLTIPMAFGTHTLVGAVAFNTLREERDWPDELVKRLHRVAEVFANVLARKQREDELRSSQARLEIGADLAGLAFYDVDFARHEMHVDDRLRRICGVPPERLGVDVLEFWLEHLHPEDRARVLEERSDLHEGRTERISIEYRFRHPDRGEIWIHHIAAVLTRDAAGQAIRTFGVFRDVTDRRQREEALRRSYEEIERLKDKLQAETDYLKAEINVTQARGELTGQSAAVAAVLGQIEQVAPTDSTVLVRGETGSGKELVAQAIHRLSSRRNRVMVKVNCAALPSGLIESELFGREKGAFTGALTRQAGRFEIADGSTLFLDEIGELPLDLQAKLLRVLESGEFERLGSSRTLKVSVRLIAATNRDLAKEVAQGRFREDLFYRLNVFPIRVPPLRERIEDIPPLVWAFIDEFSKRMGKKIAHVPRKTMEALQRCSWPGNVRQLRNVIEHSAIITTGDTLVVDRLDAPDEGSHKPVTLEEAEREFIMQALTRMAWRVKGPNGAAAALGVNPSTLYSRMKKLAISREPIR